VTDWEALYAEVSPILRRRALARLRDPDLADEVVQTVWLMVAGLAAKRDDLDARDAALSLLPRAIRAVGSRERDQRRAVVLLSENIRPTRTEEALGVAVYRPRCQVCGSFCARKDSRFCSRRCYGLSLRRSWRLCARPGCGKPVSQARARARYCSRLCEGLVRGIRYPLPLPKWLGPRTCPVCGKTWWPDSYRASRRQCCSEPCARRLAWRTVWARRDRGRVPDLIGRGAPPSPAA
jgi:predicted nucleic acid-binding Zn ribbon protein